VGEDQIDVSLPGQIEAVTRGTDEPTLYVAQCLLAHGTHPDVVIL